MQKLIEALKDEILGIEQRNGSGQLVMREYDRGYIHGIEYALAGIKKKIPSPTEARAALEDMPIGWSTGERKALNDVWLKSYGSIIRRALSAFAGVENNEN